MSKVKKLIIPASKPRNHLVALTRNRVAGVHKSDKDIKQTKSMFKNNLRKGMYD